MNLSKCAALGFARSGRVVRTNRRLRKCHDLLSPDSISTGQRSTGRSLCLVKSVASASTGQPEPAHQLSRKTAVSTTAFSTRRDTEPQPEANSGTGYGEFIPLRPSKRLVALLSVFRLHHTLPGPIDFHHPKSARRVMELPYERNSIATVLTLFIYNLLTLSTGQSPSDAVSRMPADQMDILHHRGFSAHDLAVWAHLVLAEDPFLPGSPVTMVIQSHSVSSPDRHIPSFPLLFFMSRKRVSNRAVLFLVRYFRARLLNVKAGFEAGSAIPKNQDLLHSGTLMSVFSRLLRLALQTSPGCIEPVAQLVTDYVSEIAGHQYAISTTEHTRDAVLRKVTRLCNAALDHLAVPAKETPFGSADTRAAAQFSILGAMAHFARPLTITPDGYRAIVTVQLQRPKTTNEKDWVVMQSRSSPPWKEDRTGSDADKDAEYGFSRAARAISRMLEAGYAARDWTELAIMYSGWDIDGTPLTQTRTFLKVADSASPMEKEIRRWVGRIETGRTAREAWSWFETFFESDMGRTAVAEQQPMLSEVYLAMFRKIVMARKPTYPLRGSTDDPVPGDGLEVFSDSPFEHERVELVADVPTLERLLADMLHSGVRPRYTLVHFLIRNSDGPEQLEWIISGLLPTIRTSLFTTHDDSVIARQLGLALKSFIHFLCYGKITSDHKPLFSGPIFSNILPGWRIMRHHPAVHALHLSYSLPQVDDDTFVLLTDALAFSSSGILFAPYGTPPSVQALALFRLNRAVFDKFSVERKHIPTRAFSNLAMSAYRAGRANGQIGHWFRSSPTLASSTASLSLIWAESEWVRTDGGNYLMLHFCSMIGIDHRPMSTRVETEVDADITDRNCRSESSVGPTDELVLTIVPSPALLHQLVRSLGLLGSIDNLAYLAEIISTYAPLWKAKGMKKVLDGLVYFSHVYPISNTSLNDESQSGFEPDRSESDPNSESQPGSFFSARQGLINQSDDPPSNHHTENEYQPHETEDHDADAEHRHRIEMIINTLADSGRYTWAQWPLETDLHSYATFEDRKRAVFEQMNERVR